MSLKFLFSPSQMVSVPGGELFHFASRIEGEAHDDHEWRRRRRRRERHFSARFLFLVGGDICLDGGVQSSRSRAKNSAAATLVALEFFGHFFSSHPLDDSDGDDPREELSPRTRR